MYMIYPERTVVKFKCCASLIFTLCQFKYDAFGIFTNTAHQYIHNFAK